MESGFKKKLNGKIFRHTYGFILILDSVHVYHLNKKQYMHLSL